MQLFSVTMKESFAWHGGKQFVTYDGIIFGNSDEYSEGFLYVCACYGEKFRVVETKNVLFPLIECPLQIT